MHHTTLLALLVLALGQISILGCAALFLWLAGEFGDPPSWRGLLHKGGSSDSEMSRDDAASAPRAANEMVQCVTLSPCLIGSDDSGRNPCSIDRAPSDAGAARRTISVS
jgi:hypothetical protein